MEPLPRNSYFETPYYRYTLTYDAPTGPNNNDPYPMFCLRTKVQSLLPDAYLIYQTIYNNDKMEYVIVITDATNPISLSDELYIQLHQQYNQLVVNDNNDNDCLVYETSDMLFGVPQWYQDWILPCIDLPKETQLKINPFTKKQCIYGNFVSIPDYSDYYNDCIASIEKQLTLMYNKGYIKCTSNVAEYLKLDKIKVIENKLFLCAPDWDIHEVTNKQQHIISYLLQHAVVT